MYCSGSSQDWTAKAVALLVVRAVIAKSFERIHRTNLIAMGIAPVVAELDQIGISHSSKIKLCFATDRPIPHQEVIFSLESKNGSHLTTIGHLNA